MADVTEEPTPTTEAQDIKDTPETVPTAEDKAADQELLKVDDDATSPKQEEQKPEITSNLPEDIKQEKKEDKKEEVEESDLSSSDEEDELIHNIDEWDITFKLAQFLDNHFVIALLSHLKNQKKKLQQKQNKEDINEDQATEEKQNTDDNKPATDTNPQSNTLRLKSAEISLVSQKLMSLYKDEELNRVQIELLSKTCLIDEQLALFDVLKETKMSKRDDVTSRTQQLDAYKAKVLKRLQELETICGPLIDFLGEEKAVNDLVREKALNLHAISMKGGDELKFLDNFNVDNLFAYCRLRYEIGYYQHTDLLLNYYRILTPDLQKKNAALWGTLSSQILQNKWDEAFKCIRDIREHIEDSSRTLNLNKTDEAGFDEPEEDEYTKQARELLQKEEKESNEDGKEDEKEDKQKSAKLSQGEIRKQQSLQIATIMRDRAWLLHWSLFVFFNKDVLLDELIALFLNNKYMNVIQTMCPHLLRYLTSAILISPNIDKQSKLKYLTDVSKIIVEEQYTFRDPITEFVRLVIRTNDFEGASQMLQNAMDVIQYDFFLSYYQDYFIQYARTTFLIKYCRLYERISVENISRLLLMSGNNKDQIQLWFINAIRSENIDAKLDVVENVIYVHFPETNPYQEMMNRTKSMEQRTMGLYHDINNKLRRLTEMMNNDS